MLWLISTSYLSDFISTCERGSQKKKKRQLSAAAAKLISVDAPVAAVLFELDGIFTLEEEQTAALQAFLCGKYVFALLSTRFGKS